MVGDELVRVDEGDAELDLAGLRAALEEDERARERRRREIRARYPNFDPELND